MPNKDKELVPGFDVQIIPVGSNGTAVGTPPANNPGAPIGNGYVVTSNPNSPIFVLPGAPQAPQPVQPSLVVITLSPKKDDEKKEKKNSSVFQRL
jgi:hypothetical protein